MYTRNRPQDPPRSHSEKAHGERALLGGRLIPGSAEPTLGRLILVFHVLAPAWLLVMFWGCTGCPLAGALAYK
jgi:hypothetical protein